MLVRIIVAITARITRGGAAWTRSDSTRLDALYSAVVSDACDRSGHRGQTAAPEIVRLSGPDGGTLVGWARTARSVRVDTIGARPYAGEIDLVDSLRPDDVVVAEVEGDSSAFWGELFSAAAIGRGARGLVVDGLIRDVDRIRTLGFTVFARGTRPTDCSGRIAVVEQDVPVRCGGVEVMTGDLVVADRDGIVFVPRAAVAEVMGHALEKARTETDARQLLLAGGTLAQVWERHRVL